MHKYNRKLKFKAINYSRTHMIYMSPLGMDFRFLDTA